MYQVIFYYDKDGNSEIVNWLDSLKESGGSNKNHRINWQKVLAYIGALEKYGTRIGEPYVKHLKDDIWELRPLKNRILFFYWKDDKFVLLHHFAKKIQKTPRKEIEAAERKMQDYLEGGKEMKEVRTFSEYLNDEERVSAAEREQIQFEIELIGKVIEARKQMGLSQRELAELSGVKQPAISRLESMQATPKIDTLIKILNPLGYTLSIVPLGSENR